MDKQTKQQAKQNSNKEALEASHSNNTYMADAGVFKTLRGVVALEPSFVNQSA